ncbi:hypothetical protein BDU57DRAFT_297410 [Ampelomyces quisqualis]|uniref:Uncharacterized protein n=1 Tax=Ampelomyces quisqualis TaxID=50730 RepID=A0A6A5QG69_AMPQU|nr:hypothetical protein BDU57DRAFT_297410 [Ampelomyces quisqualis]
MDPPSPSKLGMSPPWKPFALSPERAAGAIPSYGEPLTQSPSAPLLSSIPPLSPTRSPIRSPMHRRTDSDVSVQGLATMFEGLEVKDPREAAQRYKQMLEKEKTRWLEKLHRHDKDHALILERKALRIEELESELAQAKASLQVFKEREERWTSDSIKVKTLEDQNRIVEHKCRQYAKEARRLNTENLKTSSMLPTMQAKVQSLEREIRRTRSDLDHKAKDAENQKNQVYALQAELESTAARLGEEIQTLRETLMSVEGERDTLKTSLQEEEVMRIAAEGRIPLPSASADENEEFGSPVRSPRKARVLQREDDDKENVAPKKSLFELKQLQQDLATERRLRERAEDQIDFMKMECQFQCCSCRIAENKGRTFVHDSTYMADMQRIKSTVPALTPPASAHEDDVLEGVMVKEEPVEASRTCTPPVDIVRNGKQTPDEAVGDQTKAGEPQAILTFSPATGTFRAVPSPVKSHAAIHVATPAKSSNLGLSAVTGTSVEASPWTSDAHSTITSNIEPEIVTVRRGSTLKESKSVPISIHEDAIEDEDDELQAHPQEPLEPATPARYEFHTTTTTIPIAFSPATPAFRTGKGPMTPSTVAHAASDARTPVLGELSLNNLSIDREKALEQIRQRRGRTRSMADGHATPMKKMIEGVKDRRDISAPVLRTRR